MGLYETSWARERPAVDFCSANCWQRQSQSLSLICLPKRSSLDADPIAADLDDGVQSFPSCGDKSPPSPGLASAGTYLRAQAVRLRWVSPGCHQGVHRVRLRLRSRGENFALILASLEKLPYFLAPGPLPHHRSQKCSIFTPSDSASASRVSL